jgi:hypothetical protein
MAHIAETCRPTYKILPTGNNIVLTELKEILSTSTSFNHRDCQKVFQCVSKSVSSSFSESSSQWLTHNVVALSI